LRQEFNAKARRRQNAKWQGNSTKGLMDWQSAAGAGKDPGRAG